MHPEKRQKLEVKRKAKKIVGDTSRVITRPHIPSGANRIPKIIQRIAGLPDTTAEDLLAKIMLDFSERHKDIRRVFERSLNKVRDHVPRDAVLSETKRALIGPILRWNTPLNRPPFLTLPSSSTLIKAIWTKAACALS